MADFGGAIQIAEARVRPLHVVQPCVSSRVLRKQARVVAVCGPREDAPRLILSGWQVRGGSESFRN